MTTTALLAGALAAGVVLAALVAPSSGPRPVRPLPSSPPAPSPAATWSGRLGAALRRLTRSPLAPAHDRAVGRAVIAAAVATPVVPPAAPLLVVAIWAHGRIAIRRSARRATGAVARALPDAVDLLALCAGAGLSLPLAHPLVAACAPSPVGPALARADAATRRGRPRADALLDALAPLGERAHTLASVLVDHLRYGVPLEPGLERVGLELRLDRRRRAEHDARRVPVRLLAPLVACVLPAFALLTVVPLLAGSLRALPT